MATDIAGAPTASVKTLRFSPNPIRIGVVTSAIAELSFAGGAPEPFSLQAGRGLTPPGPDADPELRSAILTKNRSVWVLTLVFVAWSPGAGLLPALRVGDQSLPALRYEAESALARASGGGFPLAGTDIGPPRPQRDPPGTSLYLYGFLGLGIALVLIVIAFALWIIPGARAILARRRAREAFTLFGRTLIWLEQNAAASASPAWYALLSRSFRAFISKRLVAEADCLTPSELASLSVDRFPDAKFRDLMAELLEESDEERFGGRQGGAAARLQAVARARELGRIAEELADARI